MRDPWTEASPLQIVLACTRPFAAGERQEPLWSESLNLLVGLAGEGTVRISGRDHRLADGEVLVVPWAAEVAYAADCGCDWSLASIHLAPWDGPGVPAEARHCPADQPGVPRPPRGVLPPVPAAAVRPRSAPHVADLALAAAEAWGDTAASAGWRAWRLRGLAMCMLTALEAEAALGSPPIRDLIAWMRRAYPKPIDVAAMCRHAGLGATALGRAMRAETGLSPAAWLTRLRLDEARRLLATTRLPVAAVAGAVGIPDRSHFTRLYRRRFGHPPRHPGAVAVDR